MSAYITDAGSRQTTEGTEWGTCLGAWHCGRLKQPQQFFQSSDNSTGAPLANGVRGSTPSVCDFATLHGKCECANVTKLRTLSFKDCPGLSRGSLSQL